MWNQVVDGLALPLAYSLVWIALAVALMAGVLAVAHLVNRRGEREAGTKHRMT